MHLITEPYIQETKIERTEGRKDNSTINVTPSSQQLLELDKNKNQKNTEDLSNIIYYLDLTDNSKTLYNQQLQNTYSFQVHVVLRDTIFWAIKSRSEQGQNHYTVLHFTASPKNTKQNNLGK